MSISVKSQAPRAASLSREFAGSFQYDPLNRVSSIQWNGADGTGRNLGIGQSLTYGHLSGNIIQVAREFGQFTYGYDSTHQLVRSSYAGSVALPGEIVNRSLSFDLTGNRIDDSTNGRGDVGAGNFLVSDKRTFYRPDVDGLGHVSQKINRVTGAVQSFGYGVDGLLSRYDDTSGKSARYFHDALGRRVAKRVLEAEPLAGGAPVTKTHAYLHLGDEHRVLLAKSEGTGLGSELELLVDGPGIDEHLGKVAGTERVAFATDHLGSVLNSELSSAGGAAAALGFGPWGEELGASPTAGASASALIYGYTGREHDPESGLRYHRARQYDPVSGRWMTKDPIGFEGGNSNLYGYVSQNPVYLIDQNGKWAVPVGMGLALLFVKYVVLPQIEKHWIPTDGASPTPSPSPSSLSGLSVGGNSNSLYGAGGGHSSGGNLVGGLAVLSVAAGSNPSCP